MVALTQDIQSHIDEAIGKYRLSVSRCQEAIDWIDIHLFPSVPAAKQADLRTTKYSLEGSMRLTRRSIRILEQALSKGRIELEHLNNLVYRVIGTGPPRK